MKRNNEKNNYFFYHFEKIWNLNLTFTKLQKFSKRHLQPSKWLTIFCLLLIAGCYEAKEGCIDPESTNFDASVDDICPDCCEYPSLKVSFLHQIATSDTTTTSLVYSNAAYTVDSTHFFRINRVRFYISDLQLRYSDGSLHTGSDSITLKIPQLSGDTSDIRVPDSFILVDKDKIQAKSLGNFKKSGNFEGIQFQLGITEPANHADPNLLSDDHPLSFQEESMHLSTDAGYTFNQLSLSRNTSVRDSITVSYDMEAYDMTEELREVSLDAPFFIPQGFDVTLVLKINYLKWFEGINFQTDSEIKIAQTIADKIATSFSLDVKLE